MVRGSNGLPSHPRTFAPSHLRPLAPSPPRTSEYFSNFFHRLPSCCNRFPDLRVGVRS